MTERMICHPTIVDSEPVVCWVWVGVVFGWPSSQPRRRYGDEAEIALRSCTALISIHRASASLCDIIAMLFRAVVLLAAFATGAALRVPVVAPGTNIALARQARAVVGGHSFFSLLRGFCNSKDFECADEP